MLHVACIHVYMAATCHTCAQDITKILHCCQVVDSVRTHGALQASTCLQGNVVQLSFVKYNFTYLSQFEALGLQGEASYWFSGTIQTSVSLSMAHYTQQVGHLCICYTVLSRARLVYAQPACTPEVSA